MARPSKTSLQIKKHSQSQLPPPTRLFILGLRLFTLGLGQVGTRRVWSQATHGVGSAVSLVVPSSALSLPHGAFRCPAQEQAASSLACFPMPAGSPPRLSQYAKSASKGLVENSPPAR